MCERRTLFFFRQNKKKEQRASIECVFFLCQLMHTQTRILCSCFVYNESLLSGETALSQRTQRTLK